MNPGFLVHVNAQITCPHGGQISTISTNSRVLVSNQAVVTVKDTSLVSGCPFTVGNKSQPCVSVQWLMPAKRVFVNGEPVLLQSSTGICQSAEQAQQGISLINATQTRVSGM